MLSAAALENGIQAQEGPQKAFLESPADIAVSGGAKGGGKTFGLELESTRHVAVPGFGGVIFRREYPQITAQGGLWETSTEIYPHLGGVPKESDHEWRFPSGVRITFSHMQYEKDRLKWDGSQIAFIGIDQAEQFTEKQFWTLVSCNRSVCGEPPYMRLTCNPDPRSFLKKLMAWWIDRKTGYAIPERSGVLRWYVRIDEEMLWGDSAEELIEKYGDDCEPLSFTFIPSTVHDNPILLEKDPGYMAKLKALPRVDRERLLGEKGKGGNWNILEEAGSFFTREDFRIVKAAPPCVDVIRYWDRAATPEARARKKTSHTAGVKMGKTRDGLIVVMDCRRFQEGPDGVKKKIRNTATQDGPGVRIGIEQDPGQAGISEAKDQVRNLHGFDVTINRVHESKGVRATPYSAQAQGGNVVLVEGDWNDDFIEEHANFDGTPLCVSDQVDGGSGAYFLLTDAPETFTSEEDLYAIKAEPLPERW
jgi:predicted phage terminase large subunit-like protein